jgi:hypothetical protein
MVTMDDHNISEHQMHVLELVRNGRQRDIYNAMCDVVEGEEMSIVMTSVCLLIAAILTDRCATRQEIDGGIHLMAQQVREGIYEIRRKNGVNDEG